MREPTPGAVQPVTADTTAIILCGGAGRRIGGADKPLFEYGPLPLVAHVATSFTGLVDRVLISANRNLHVYAPYGEVVVDDSPGTATAASGTTPSGAAAATRYQGPLAGVAACLERTVTPFAIICPGDAPRVSADLWKRLLNASRTSEAAAVCAHDGERRQPLFLVLNLQHPHRHFPVLRNYLGDGRRSVLGWLEIIDCVDVDCGDLAFQLEDVDTLRDLNALKSSGKEPATD